MSDVGLTQALEVALYDVPESVFARIKETVDGDREIAVTEWLTLDENGTVCGCLLFDGYTTDQGRAHDALTNIRNEDDTDLTAAEILSDFYGVEITKSIDDWGMSLVRAYDNWASESDEDGDPLYHFDDSLLNEAGRIELRRIFAAEARRRAS